MKPCVACGSHDNVRKAGGFLLCWTCRRCPHVPVILAARQEVRSLSGSVLRQYSRPTRERMLREAVRWE